MTLTKMKMDNDQLTALAREYAEWITEAEGGNNAYIPAEQAIASTFLHWLSRRFYLVEKSRMEELEITRRARVNGCVMLMREDVKFLFPEIAKEVES